MLRLIALALVSLALASGAGSSGRRAGAGNRGRLGRCRRSVRTTRYVAIPSDRTTAIAAVRTNSDGRVLRYATIRGTFGVPVVAFDGTTEGLSRDGKTLVLATYAGASDQKTRFAVLRTTPLRLKKMVTVRGAWSYDALSPTAGRSTRSSTTGPAPTRATTSARSASSPASRSAVPSLTSATRTRR